MNGPIPTIAFMFKATASLRPSPRSSFSDGKSVGMDGAKRPKHIRCMTGAKASRGLGNMRGACRCRTLHERHERYATRKFKTASKAGAPATVLESHYSDISDGKWPS